MRLQNVLRGTALAVAAFAATACVSITTYDATTDELLTGIQKRNAKFFSGLIRTYQPPGTLKPGAEPACRYSAHADYYEATYVDLRVAELRANAIPDNQATISALESLKAAVEGVEAAHKAAETSRPEKCLPDAIVQTNDTAITSAVGAILKLELAKKVK